MRRRKGHALRRRYGRSHTAARHVAEEALRAAYDNPTVRSIGLVERLYEQAAAKANVEGHVADAQRMWSRHNDVAEIVPYPIGGESGDDFRERARKAIHMIMEKS
jgi:hypothetical protein